MKQKTKQNKTKKKKHFIFLNPFGEKKKRQVKFIHGCVHIYKITMRGIEKKCKINFVLLNFFSLNIDSALFGIGLQPKLFFEVIQNGGRFEQRSVIKFLVVK